MDTQPLSIPDQYAREQPGITSQHQELIAQTQRDWNAQDSSGGVYIEATLEPAPVHKQQQATMNSYQQDVGYRNPGFSGQEGGTRQDPTARQQVRPRQHSYGQQITQVNEQPAFNLQPVSHKFKSKGRRHVKDINYQSNESHMTSNYQSNVSHVTSNYQSNVRNFEATGTIESSQMKSPGSQFSGRSGAVEISPVPPSGGRAEQDEWQEVSLYVRRPSLEDVRRSFHDNPSANQSQDFVVRTNIPREPPPRSDISSSLKSPPPLIMVNDEAMQF